jgi:hypothetical protein
MVVLMVGRRKPVNVGRCCRGGGERKSKNINLVRVRAGCYDSWAAWVSERTAEEWREVMGMASEHG